MNCFKTDGFSHGMTLTVALALGLVVFGSPRANAEISDFYTIDSQAVMEVHPAFQDAMQEYQEQIQQMQQQLQEADEQQRAMMQQMMQQQMQQLGTELQEEAFSAMQNDIQELAEEKGYGTILDGNVVIVGGEDITNEVIDALDIEVPEPEEPVMPEGEAPVMP